ncbi:restriction endonuclease subunit S [Xanthomonas oryzae pv. oryzae]|nr:restriction endonuclease subunit S [Xanthomonas oryzae pv. oryzae]UZF10101.1 type I restriction endonuclease subunit S [Xanthomonas oryzae pv. oryzae]
MVSELPGGWVETTIGEICAMGPKSAWDDGMEIGFVPMSHAPTNFRGPLNYEARRWHEVKKAYTHFENDDVIFAKVTPCFENGKAALVAGLPNGAGAGSSEFHVLRRRDAGISPSYLLAVIKSAQFLREGEENMTGAVGLRRVPRAFVENFPVRLPPEAEQKRIAQKLDALLAQVDTLKARIEAIPALLKRFRHTTLAAAANGDLTKDWRESTGSNSNPESADQYLARILEERQASPRTKFKPPVAPDTETRTPKVPASWAVSSVAAFAECLDSMRVPVKKELRAREGGTYPYFGANGEVDRVDEFIFDDDLVLVTEDETFYGRVKPIAYMYSGRCWVNNHVHALRAHDRVGQSFLCYTLMHYDVAPWLTGTTGRAKLTQGALMALPIGVPPPDEQTEIVRRIEQLFAYADQLEAKVAAAQQRIDALTQSLLAKAFRGELVPQDPTAEPASVLLERIRTQRAATPKPKRGRKAATS